MEPIIPATVRIGNSPTYKIGKKLGEGGYGQVFLGQKVSGASNSIMHGPEEVAIKFEKVYRKGKERPPPPEWGAYDQLGGCEGIPRIYFKGRLGQFYVMIMDLLGPSLCKICSSKGPLLLHSDVNLIATQAISILETLHNKGFVHCDIKPENILFGRVGSANEKKLYIADLGSAMTWRDRLTGEQKLNGPTREHMRGTPRYSSINSHAGMKPSRADDLESLAYTLVFLIKLYLPWKQFEKESNSTQLTYLGKARISPGALCRACPTALENFLSLVKEIPFGAKPDYRKLISLFDGTKRRTKQERDNENGNYAESAKRRKI